VHSVQRQHQIGSAGFSARFALALACVALISGRGPDASPQLGRFSRGFDRLARMTARTLRPVVAPTPAPARVAIVAPEAESLDAALVARVRDVHPDVLVVLGARVRNGLPGHHLLQRVATAFALFRALGDRPSLLLTGGRGEALAMRDLLVARGVPESKLLLETRSGSTVQNAQFSTAMLAHASQRFRSVLIVTTAVLRGGRVADDHAQRAFNDFSRFRRSYRLSSVSVNAEPWIAPRIYVSPDRSAHARWRASR